MVITVHINAIIPTSLQYYYHNYYVYFNLTIICCTNNADVMYRILTLMKKISCDFYNIILI